MSKTKTNTKNINIPTLNSENGNNHYDFKLYDHIQGKPLKASTLDWFDFHFSPSSFDGHFQVCYLRDSNFCQLWSGSRENIRNFLKEMAIFNKSNYYITANSTCNHKRRKNSLFSLENIVIDIDCHQECVNPYDRQEALEAFLFRLQQLDDVIPAPHSIVWTGRGLQLWWKITPVHCGCIYFYDKAKNYLFQMMEIILEDYKSDLSVLSLDRGASFNAVGLFRLPGTKNPHVNKEVSFVRTQVDEPYDLDVFLEKEQENQEELEERDHLQKSKSTTRWRNTLKEKDPFAGQYGDDDIALLEKTNCLSFFRLKQLTQLRLHRDKAIGMEERNNFTLLAYCALRASFDHPESMMRVQLFNQGFKQPMTESQLENTLVTATLKGGYRYSNETIIDFLQITKEEQELLALYPAKNKEVGFINTSTHVTRDNQNKLKKENSIARIGNMVMEGLTNKAIAKATNLSVKTIGKYAKPFRQERKESICQTLKEYGKKIIPSLSKETNIAQSTLYSYCATLA